MSTAEDPKETLKNLFKTSMTLYKDDGATPATFQVCDEFNEETWKNYDVTITVGLETQKDKTLNLGGSRREIIASYRIGVWTRDTADVDGQKMRWQVLQEVTRIVNANAKSPSGILAWMRLAGRVDSDKTSLKPVLCHSQIIVETHRYETA